MSGIVNQALAWLNAHFDRASAGWPGEQTSATASAPRLSSHRRPEPRTTV